MGMRKFKDLLIKGVALMATGISVGVLLVILTFIFSRGLPLLNGDFLKNDYNSVSQYVFISEQGLRFEKPRELNDNEVFLETHGVILLENQINSREKVFEIVYMHQQSSFRQTMNGLGEVYPLREKDFINRIGSQNTTEMSLNDVKLALDQTSDIRVRNVRPGGGVRPMVITTVMLIGLSLTFAIPIGVLAAIYLVEYAKPGRMINIIRFATESLAGIPSIVYGLFGMIFFVKMLNIGTSLLAGSLTLSILLLPTVIRTTEETLKTVPISYKEASFGLGANRLQTLSKIILPFSIPGILVAVILSIGRIVGESAALLFTLGTFAKIPESLRDSGATLTVRAFMEVKEYGNVSMAAAMGVVLISIVFVLNTMARLISSRLTSNKI